MTKVVYVYTGGETCGDFVKCIDCEKLFLLRFGGENCPKCGSENLMWVDSENPEWDIADLEAAGYEIQMGGKFDE